MILKWFLFLLISSKVTGLRIKFDPSIKLTNLSSFPDLNLFNLTVKSLANDQFWPLLCGFMEARYYKAPTLKKVLENSDCRMINELFQREGFPLRQLITPDLLDSKHIATCLSNLPLDFFLKTRINPMESQRYAPSEWRSDQNYHFLTSSFNRPNLRTNWHNWCHDPNLTVLDTFGPSLTDWTLWIWKTTSFYCINALQEPISMRLINIISPEDDLIEFYESRQTMRTRLTKLFSKRAGANSTTEEAIHFSIRQIMKVITLSTCILARPSSQEVVSRAKFVLNNYLSILKRNKRRFPFRHELKRLLHNLLLASPRERDAISIIQAHLLAMTEFCRGQVIGPWLLNVFLIWNYFCGADTLITTEQFIDPFLNVFFAKESMATASDTCLLLRFVNSILSGPYDDYFITEHIIASQFTRRLSLAREVFLECPSEIPRDKIIDSSIFPIELRLESLLKRSRFVDKITNYPIRLSLKRPPERLCLSVIHEITALLDHKKPDNFVFFPLNSKVITSGAIFRGNLPGLLTLFLKSLLLCEKWFHIKMGGLKPTILPTLSFPPHFMETIGFLLAQAVVSNVKIPFYIDFTYFNLMDTLTSQTEPSMTITTLLQKLYPNLLAEYSSNIQTYRIIRSLSYTTTRMLSLIDPNYNIFGNDGFEPDFIVNSSYDMYRIILMGSERLKMGLSAALPCYFLDSPQLYKLIFN